MSIGERLRQAMAARGVGTNELNRLARLPDGSILSHGYVSRVAGGHKESPRLDKLRALAMALRVRFEWLAFGDGAMDMASGERPGLAQAVRQERDRGSKAG